MSWTAWLLRTVVCALCVAAGILGWFAYQRTNSEAVRRRLIEQIEGKFQGIEVEIGSAWLRPLGGISVRDLRLKRRDDPNHPLLVVPSAFIYHDKEQLAHGRLVIRKIELEQPTCLLRRDMEGNWNLSGLARPGCGDGPIPVVVIRQGTVRYEDRSSGVTRPVLEVRDISATAVNDPAARVTFQGKAQSILGPVKWSGAWRRDQCKGTAAVEFAEFALTPALMHDLGRHVPQLTEHLSDFEARGDARLELSFQPGGPARWKPDLSVNLRHGRLRHPRLPLPLDGLEVKLQYHDDQITVKRCKGRSAATEFSLTLDATVPPAGIALDNPEQFLSFLNLSVRNLTLSSELFKQMPANLQRIHTAFQPTGPISLTYEYKRSERFWSRRCTTHPEGMEARHVRFPYRLRDLRGTLDQYSDSNGADRFTVNLTGTASGRPVTIDGEADGDGLKRKMELRIHARDLPLDANLFDALGKHRATVESFHPTGAGDVDVVFRDRPGNPETEIRGRVAFHGLSICADAFPYPLEDMTGVLRVAIGPETRLEFQNFRGRHHGGEVTINGGDDIDPAGNVLSLAVTGAGLPFDADLARAVGKLKLNSVWRSMGPRGRLSFVARMSHIDKAPLPNMPKPPAEFEVKFDRFRADALVPDFLPYELNNVSLALRYLSARNRVVITDFQGTHGASEVKVGAGEIFIKPGGGMWGDFRNIQFNPLVPDDELRAALPVGLRSTIATVEPTGVMHLNASRVVVDLGPPPPEPVHMPGAKREPRPLVPDSAAPWIYWDGAVITFAGASLKLGARFDTVFGELGSRGEYRNGRLGTVEGNLSFTDAAVFRQPVRHLHAQLALEPARAPGVLQIRNIKCEVYGGTVAGQGKILLGPSLRYELSLNGVQLKLEEAARSNRLGPDAQLSGKAMVQLYLKGQGGDPATLTGGGRIDVPKGKLYDLPPLLDLLKFLKLRTPDGTAFEEAHVQFRIQGKRLQFEEIELLGSVVSLTGSGEMNLDGTDVKLDVSTVWTRVVQALPSRAREVPNTVSRNLYQIEMRGSLGGQLDIRGEPLPGLTERLRRLLGRAP